jgi:hypothetical protein
MIPDDRCARMRRLRTRILCTKAMRKSVTTLRKGRDGVLPSAVRLHDEAVYHEPQTSRGPPSVQSQALTPQAQPAVVFFLVCF